MQAATAPDLSAATDSAAPLLGPALCPCILPCSNSHTTQVRTPAHLSHPGGCMDPPCLAAASVPSAMVPPARAPGGITACCTLQGAVTGTVQFRQIRAMLDRQHAISRCRFWTCDAPTLSGRGNPPCCCKHQSLAHAVCRSQKPPDSLSLAHFLPVNIWYRCSSSAVPAPCSPAAVPSTKSAGSGIPCRNQGSAWPCTRCQCYDTDNLVQSGWKPERVVVVQRTVSQTRSQTAVSSQWDDPGSSYSRMHVFRQGTSTVVPTAA
jgi:hypothetical protein